MLGGRICWGIGCVVTLTHHSEHTHSKHPIVNTMVNTPCTTIILKRSNKEDHHHDQTKKIIIIPCHGHGKSCYLKKQQHAHHPMWCDEGHRNDATQSCFSTILLLPVGGGGGGGGGGGVVWRWVFVWMRGCGCLCINFKYGWCGFV